EQVEVERVVAPRVACLAVEQLHGLHAAEVLGKVGVRLRRAQAHGAVGGALATPEEVEGEEQRRHDDKCYQCQLPVDGEHVDEQADQQPDVGDETNYSVGHHLLDGVDVRRYAGDEPT